MSNKILNLETDIRLDPCDLTGSLWLAYLPFRDAIQVYISQTLDEEIIVCPPLETKHISYNIHEVLAALDAFILFTPVSVEAERKTHLSKLVIDPHQNPMIPHIGNIGYLVHVVYNAVKAAHARPGSAAQSLISTPKWLMAQQEFNEPIISVARDEFVRSSLPNFPANPESVVSLQSHGDTETVETAAREEQPSTSIRGYSTSSVISLQPHEDIEVPPSSSDNSLHLDDQIARDKESIKCAKERDNWECIISKAHILETAHIIPYACGNFSEFFSSHAYWVFLQILLGHGVAKSLWDFVGGENINRLENMLCLNSFVHQLFGGAEILLIPVKTGPPSAVSNGRFRWMAVRYECLTNKRVLAGTPFPKFKETDVEKLPKTRKTREKIKSPDRLIEDGDIFLIYTENPGQRPLPRMELLAITALFGRLMHHLLTEGMQAGMNEVKDKNEDKTKGRGKEKSDRELSQQGSLEGTGSGKRERGRRGGGIVGGRRRGEGGRNRVNFSEVGFKLSIYAKAMAIGMKIPTKQEMTRIRKAQLACIGYEEEEDNDEFKF